MDHSIKNGPQDKPFLFLNPAEGGGIVFDPTDKLGGMYMLDHDFKGCLTLPFSKEVIPEGGRVLLADWPVPFVVKKIRIMSDIDLYMLGVRLVGRIVDYGIEASLSISGFTDLNGNEMDPVQLTVYTEPQARPLPEYATHEAVALQAAEDSSSGVAVPSAAEQKHSIIPTETQTARRIRRSFFTGFSSSLMALSTHWRLRSSHTSSERFRSTSS